MNRSTSDRWWMLVPSSARTILLAGWFHLLHSMNDTPIRSNLYYVMFVLYEKAQPFLELWPDMPTVCLDAEGRDVQRISLVECRLVTIAIGLVNTHRHSLQVTLNKKKIILSTESVHVMHQWIWTLKDTLQKLNIMPTAEDVENSQNPPSLPPKNKSAENNYEYIYPKSSHSCVEPPQAVSSPPNRVSFREAQVAKLREEMALSFNNNGICFVIPKKELLKGVALVDSPTSEVIIMGWRQQAYPHLADRFHIGDRIVEVDGRPMASVKCLQSCLRGCSDNVQLTLQRLPFAKVICIKRDFDRQHLGIVCDPSRPTVVTNVLDNSLAERAGLNYRCTLYHDQSFDEPVQKWIITEINNRPLNLFVKGDEIEQRLQAMGKEISIVFQPFFFIDKCLKKLKKVKDYKHHILCA